MNTTLYSRQPYWCITYTVVIQNILYLYVNLDIVSYNKRKGQADGVLLEVPRFVTSVYTITKHFYLGFAYGSPKIWDDLPDDVRSATSLHSFRKRLKTIILHKHIHPYFCFSWSLSMALTLLCLRFMVIVSCFFCMVCLESVF